MSPEVPVGTEGDMLIYPLKSDILFVCECKTHDNWFIILLQKNVFFATFLIIVRNCSSNISNQMPFGVVYIYQCFIIVALNFFFIEHFYEISKQLFNMENLFS